MTESLINLSKYTSKNDARVFANKVINISGYLGVCNGHILIIDETTKDKHYGFLDFHSERKQQVQDYKLEDQLNSIRENLDSFVWDDMPPINDEHYRDCHDCNDRGLVPIREDGCSECKGSGEVELENDHNSYEIECKGCNGDGNAFAGGFEPCNKCAGTKKHLSYVPVLTVNTKWALSGEYVQSLGRLPNVKLSWQEQYEFFAFKFTGGFGIIMPMRT